MHFHPREQAVLREVGLSEEEIATASERVVDATRDAAAAIESFFENLETVHSDLDLAHSDGGTQEHDLAYVDCFTHADDIRGYLRFDSWGVPIEGGRVLNDDVVELSLGPTIHGRARFAADPDAL